MRPVVLPVLPTQCLGAKERIGEMPTPERANSFLEVHGEWATGRITQARAADRMGVADRTFRRYVAKFRAGELPLLEDGSIDRRSALRVPEEEAAELVRLYRRVYSGWNVRHFYDAYRTRHNGRRSLSWVRSCLKRAGQGPTARGNGSRRSPPQPRRPNPKKRPVQTDREGVLLHQLGSEHAWVPGSNWHLTVTFDDATRRVYSGFFAERRTIWTAFRGVRETVERRGLFERLGLGVTSGEYWKPGPSGVANRRHHAQFDRAMRELGIAISPRPPAVLVRAARLFSTIRTRLPQELSYHNIEQVHEANQFLDRYWPRFNEAFRSKPRTGPPAFVAPGPSIKPTLDNVLCIKHRGRIIRGHRIQLRGRALQVPSSAGRSCRLSAEVVVHEYQDGSIAVFEGRDELFSLGAGDPKSDQTT